MTTNLRNGFSAMVATAGLVALACMPGGEPGGSVTPIPSAAPTASAAPTEAPTRAPASPRPAPPTPFATSGTVAYTSAVHGYTVQRPAGWLVTPATEPWPDSVRLDGHIRAWFDVFEGPEAAPEFNWLVVTSQALKVTDSPDAWLAGYANSVEASGRDCKGPAEAWTSDKVGSVEITRLDLECQGVRITDVAFVLDGVGYVMSGNRPAILQFLETFEARAS